MSQRMPDYESLRERQARAQEGHVPVPESCPTRLMDGRNVIRCWLNAGHEGECR